MACVKVREELLGNLMCNPQPYIVDAPNVAEVLKDGREGAQLGQNALSTHLFHLHIVDSVALSRAHPR